jgi:hypothetical protein
MFVLPCVGSGLETDWSPVQEVLPTVYEIHNSRAILMWNRPEALLWKGRRKELHFSNRCSISVLCFGYFLLNFK